MMSKRMGKIPKIVPFADDGAAFALLDEKWRPAFLKKVGEELDARGRHRHREQWRVLLSGQEEESQAAPDPGLP